jgi:DNA-binding transcriptional ArsR family regulator
MNGQKSPPCCPPKPKLDERPLLTSEQAAGLMDLFKVLANDTRLKLLHALARVGELCVSDLAEAVEMKPQAVSNQLQRLVDRGILGSRRDGRSVHYRIVDPCVTSLLDLGLCLAEDSETRRGRARVATLATGSPSPGARGSG